MADLLANNFRYRRSFSKVPLVPIENLISVQRESYEQFLQSDIAVEDRKNVGLQAVFKSVFPIRDFSGKAELQFVSYELEPPKYDEEECRERGMTFNAPLKVTVQSADSGPESGFHLVSVPANTWTEVTVTRAQLGNPAVIRRINLQLYQAAPWTAFVDEIRILP